MKWLTLAVILFSCAYNDSVRCRRNDDKKPLKIPSEQLEFNTFLNMIEDLSFDEFDNDNLCRIQIYINNNDKTVTLKFIKDLLNNRSENQDIHVNTFIQNSTGPNLDVYHVIDYACSSDNCEEKFLLQIRELLSTFLLLCPLCVHQEVLPFIYGYGDEPCE